MFDRILSKGRVRAASRRLSSESTARNYSALAQAHAAIDQLSEVQKVCEEGLSLFPGDAELLRLKERATTLHREDRVRELQRLLKTAPRPAHWKELCEIQLDAGRAARAEQAAADWYAATGEVEALFHQAKVRAERYFSDRRRDDARCALELAAECVSLAPTDMRPARLQLSIYSRCGAWNEARTCLARLLELYPGDPALEARFRTVASLAEKSRSLDSALREVERTGNFVDDESDDDRAQNAASSVRPVLQSIASEPGVRGAFYVRGATALVQGPKGATAERQARGVRELVSSSRSAARRLGLGQPLEVSFEGDFGALHINPGSVGAAAIWTERQPSRKHLEALASLSRFENQSPEVEA
jgi:tetratricopeptide (TPR) repeat protein